MKRLRRSIVRTGTVSKAAEAGYSQVSGENAAPGGTPMVMPLAQVLVFPEPGGTYSTLAYRGMVPIYTPDGAAHAATQPGRWGQLARAGRP